MINSPCDSCLSTCNGYKYRECIKYRDWLHAWLERIGRPEEPEPEKTPYQIHLDWMVQACGWRDE